MESVQVAIVGAGLGGLALAVGLQHRGITAHIYEKTDGAKADTATGISIGLNGGRALDGIQPGLLDLMKSAGSQTKKLKFIDHTGGKEPVELEFDKSPVLFMIPWRRARSILFDSLPRSNIHSFHKLVSYKAASKDKGGVDLVFEVKDEQGQIGEKIVHAAVVIGADGVHSAVRKIMVGDRPRDLHLINWNALVDNPDSKFFKVHEKDQIVMIRNGATFAHLADSGEGCTLWVLRMHNEDISGAAYGGPAAKERVLKAIDGLEPAHIWEPLKTAVEATRPDLIFERKIIDNTPLKSWSDLDGQVLLMGDAAHAMHWGPGQGARTAFEDAHQLAELLAGALATGETAEIKKAVRRFEEMRIPRMTKFQEHAAESTELPEFIPDWVQRMPVAERLRRMREFQAWADSYPDKMLGDPDFTYFKP